MLLQDECKPFFDAIRRILEKKGDMPRAQEALRHLAEAQEHVALVDAREQYLAEALTPRKGTLLIYIEGDKHRPIRKRVVGVTDEHVLVEWYHANLQNKRFDVLTRRALDASPVQNRPADVLDEKELQELLASLPHAPA